MVSDFRLGFGLGLSTRSVRNRERGPRAQRLNVTRMPSRNLTLKPPDRNVASASRPAHFSLLKISRPVHARRVLGALLGAQRPPPDVATAATARDVSAAERLEIRRARLYEALPEGWFFDGANYVDFEGREYAEHPDMPRFVDDWLAARNAGGAGGDTG